MKVNKNCGDLMYCMVETASDNKAEIKIISEKLLDLKLVASTHILESESSWNWNSTRAGATEFILQMKIKKDYLNDIYEVIKSIHSYDCFEFAVYEITSINKDYLNWIDKETK